MSNKKEAYELFKQAQVLNHFDRWLCFVYGYLESSMTRKQIQAFREQFEKDREREAERIVGSRISNK